MKQTIFTLLLLSTIGLLSCRKVKNEQNIQQYDLAQIKSYIANNNIAGMLADSNGIYYHIISSGSGPDTLTYPDKVSFVFTLRSFDGKYTNTDTIANHYDGYIGHIQAGNLPLGLEIAIINDLKYKGEGSMRLLIPSSLAYGPSGFGSGSSTLTNTRIAGNQCLDYYVHVISNQAAYDDLVIKNYISRKNLTGYIADTGIYSRIYYKITIPGTGTSQINDNSTVTINRQGQLLNGTLFDTGNSAIADSVAIEFPNFLVGEQAILKRVTKGATVSMLIPSAFAYGETGATGVPVNSCLRYEYSVRGVTP